MGIVMDSSEVESESESEWEMERRQAKGNSPMKKGVNTGSKRTDVQPFKRQPHKMVKLTQTIRWLSQMVGWFKLDADVYSEPFRKQLTDFSL